MLLYIILYISKILNYLFNSYTKIFFINLFIYISYNFLFYLFEFYHYIKNEILFYHNKYKLKKYNINRFVNNDVIINTYTNKIINCKINNIYFFDDLFLYNKIYFCICDNNEYNFKKIIFIDFTYIKSIEYINVIRSKKLFKLVVKYSLWKYPIDILKIIDNYI